MIMHEECLDGNFKSVEDLREASRRKVSVPHVKQVIFVIDLAKYKWV